MEHSRGGCGGGGGGGDAAAAEEGGSGRGDVGVGGESAARPETVEDAGGEDIMAGWMHRRRHRQGFQKSDGTVGMPILRSRRVPPSEAQIAE
ncbi:Os10g0420801 [Oryza sativa Japonica Group]|uniref:Os10g0420801 protein n=1 Tax=Oryza sativa subsp. japonica TaxID=39947 RepID=C7J7T7_ORYSJ|nr:Os10g0420801 [Oryza sativa Japonica Group]|eukprot:NP_001176156.1 Os10g0420801 [Oryza sativa Japonica Group]